MSMSDKPWMRPVIYTDDRWTEPAHAESMAAHAASGGPGYDDSPDERDARDVEEILNRPERDPDDKQYECNDLTPINYAKGPHAEEFGLDDHEFDAPDPDPVPYDAGPHDDEFGIDNEEDLEPIDADDEDFPDE